MRRPIRERSGPTFARRSGKEFRRQFRLVRRYPRGKAVRFYSWRNRFVIERLSRGSVEPNQKSTWRTFRQEQRFPSRRNCLLIGGLETAPPRGRRDELRRAWTRGHRI